MRNASERTSTGRVPDANSLETFRVIHQRALGYNIGVGLSITTRAKIIQARGQVVGATLEVPNRLKDSQKA